MPLCESSSSKTTYALLNLAMVHCPCPRKQAIVCQPFGLAKIPWLSIVETLSLYHSSFLLYGLLVYTSACLRQWLTTLCFSMLPRSLKHLYLFCFAVCSLIHQQVQQQMLQPEAGLSSQDDSAIGKPSLRCCWRGSR
jgi:hypothetical protein